MNILIIGCGDVGATLADELSAQGHDISVVDSRPERFANLSGGFRGMITQGFECDMGVLGKAGIDSCDVVIAVAEDDNINIMAAQIVKGKY